LRILRHSKLIVVTLVVAAGCGTDESTLEFASKFPLLQGMIPACSTDAKKHLKRVKWKDARTIDVRIRQGEFSPMIIGLTKDKPYILRIQNADDKSRNFKAGEFFRSVALSRVAINGKAKRLDCITGVTVKPHQVAELELVAIRDGRYEFEDNFLSFFYGTAGVIHVNLPLKPLIQKAKFPINPVDFEPQEVPAAKAAPTPPPAVPTTPVTPALPPLFELPSQDTTSSLKLPPGPS
jgi:hypothetical protein